MCKTRFRQEAFSDYFPNIITPMLALIMVLTSIMLLVEFKPSEHFPEVLAFVTTTTGAVIGFYFGGRRTTRSQSTSPTKKHEADA